MKPIEGMQLAALIVALTAALGTTGISRGAMRELQAIRALRDPAPRSTSTAAPAQSSPRDHAAPTGDPAAHVVELESLPLEGAIPAAHAAKTAAPSPVSRAPRVAARHPAAPAAARASARDADGI